jgi:hypothetical protein
VRATPEANLTRDRLNAWERGRGEETRKRESAGTGRIPAYFRSFGLWSAGSIFLSARRTSTHSRICWYGYSKSSFFTFAGSYSTSSGLAASSKYPGLALVPSFRSSGRVNAKVLPVAVSVIRRAIGWSFLPQSSSVAHVLGPAGEP